MMNYYIVGPSSTNYIISLGGDEAFAGFLIGATPLAAMVSALFYSQWTSSGYKSPILFSSCLCILGNLLYFSALEYDCVYFLFAGRFLVGLGGCRGLNRRYIADNVSSIHRTQTLSWFVSAGAAGMAFGPAMAVALHQLNLIFKIPFTSYELELNGENSPGLLMFLMWGIYGCSVAFWFVEKPRNFFQHQYSAVAPITPINYGATPVSQPLPQPHHPQQTSISPVKIHQLRAELTGPIILLLVLLFINKFIVEEIISSGPIITNHNFGWTVSHIGSLGAAIGLLVVPLSAMVGWCSYRGISDRFLIFHLFFFAMVGLLIFLSKNTSTSTYIVGYLIVFASLQACESVLMSSLSKIVSPRLAAGTFNAGLLATEFGTAGRVTANGFLTAAGLLVDPNILFDVLFLPALVLVCASLFFIRRNWKFLSTENV